MKNSYFPLGSIEVLDGYSKNAFEKEIEYLLSLEEGRLLAGFYQNAGIQTPFVRYGGWENSLIGGHTIGHYLTALSQASVHANGTECVKEKIRRKISRILDGFDECQRALGSGLIWGATLPERGQIESQFDAVEEGKSNIVKESWVPWYTVHKLLSGLIVCFRLTGEVRAKTVAVRLGKWIVNRVSRWDEQTRKTVLSIEYGGMNDCLYDLYEITGETSFAVCAHAFDEEDLFDKILSRQPNVLKGKHANTTIPKILGALNRYRVLHGKELCGEMIDAERYLQVAKTFFHTVVEKHTYVTGGNSEWEHFGEDGILDRKRTNCNCETCNAYNMLFLARGLFSLTGEKEYADFYERTYLNSILSSQNPQTGMTTYFQPMASGFFKVYGEPFDKFWCCTGSGMENFTKLGDGIYTRFDGGISVQLYLSSRLKTEEVTLVQTTNFPWEETAQFQVDRAEKPVDLRFRRPDWAKGEMKLSVNGRALPSTGGEYEKVRVAEGDRIAVTITQGITLNPLSDDESATAFCYGGYVLSADLGREEMETAQTGVIVTVPKRKICATETIYFDDLQRITSAPDVCFRREGEILRLTEGDLPLQFGLHYQRYRERYGIYWYLKEGDRRAEERRERPVLDVVQVGYGQYESDELHAMREMDSVGVTSEGTYRFAKAGGCFAYDVAVDAHKKNVLSIRLRAEDSFKPLKISVGDAVVFDEVLLYAQEEKEYVREIPLSDAQINRAVKRKKAFGKTYTVVTVKVEGSDREESARLCSFLTVYGDEKESLDGKRGTKK